MYTAKFKLLPYQQRWLDDTSRFKIAMFSRQTGKTFTTTLEIVRDLIKSEIEGKATRWVILSRGERQAKEALNEGVLKHLKVMSSYLDIKPSITATDITFPSGSKLSALPANPDTARGFSANVFLDEFAFHEDSEKIWAALFPVISHGDKRLIITSTPNGRSNRFFKIWEEAEGWSRHKVNIYDAVADGLPRDVDQLKQMLNDADAWRQEFELEWLDESSAFFNEGLIKSTLYTGNSQELKEHGPIYLGVDIAIRGDNFSVAVIERIGDVFWLRDLVIHKNLTFKQQDEVIDSLIKAYGNVSKITIDQTGIGERSVEELTGRYGKSVVAGKIFTSQSKLEMGLKLRRIMEQARLRISVSEDKLISDLLKIRRTVGSTGAVKLTASRDSSGHADAAWALMLAIDATDDLKDYAGEALPRMLPFAASKVTINKDGWGII